MRTNLLLYHGVSLMSHLSQAWFPPPTPTLFAPNMIWSGNNALHQMCYTPNHSRCIYPNIEKICQYRRQRPRSRCKYHTSDPVCKAMIECVFKMMDICRPGDRWMKRRKNKYCKAQKRQYIMGRQHIDPCDLEVCLTSSQCT